MNVYISVVSHGHGNLIKELGVLTSLSEDFHVIVKNNKPDDDLISYAQGKNIDIIDYFYLEGFGSNNNIVYNYCVTELGMRECDLFIVLNPDVSICKESILKLSKEMNVNNILLSTINLYKDFCFSEYDNSIRYFPKLRDFILSFLGMGNRTIIDKNLIDDVSLVDWAAGSFLAFNSGYYSQLKGFDENYFMYCEDIDICYRSSILSKKVTFFKSIKAVHLAQHSNRKIFSKHFYWHVKSVFRFILSKYHFTKVRSKIN